ncbi:MAG: RNA-guided pseudouridylation complex pseudouridine synthase subunit Cbf5 [Candidatus Aenigmarchaeota archaeon]|nr:RNA-guided pseudouridylation complex pseudouridine synthase subunit Cbf5 [Candidatus Aenigmarchaeota archaeon]
MKDTENSPTDTHQDAENTEYLTKSRAKTDPKHGCPPDKRDIETHIKNGLIILDKPKGPTSHQVAAWVRDIFKPQLEKPGTSEASERIFSLKKAGHSGTLDPGVTGVLPTLLENATKIIPALVRGKKEYICLMQLHTDIPQKQITETARSFVGKIQQMPPVKSAVKRQLRTREIYTLDILEIDKRNVLFKSEVEAGTYIRTLCTDFGKKLKTQAHMQELRRTMAGSLPEEQSHTLQDIKDAYEFYKEEKNEKFLRDIIKPLETGVMHLQKIIIKDSAISAICHGAPLRICGIAKYTKDIKTNDIIAIMSLKGELVALAESTMNTTEIQDKDKGIAAKITRVIMPENTYPRTW